jgi:hypothetical protein
LRGGAPHLYSRCKIKSMTVELLTKCLEIENWTRSLTLRGLEREEIVARIDEMYEPETEEEMEAYSEAIIYARLGVLN